MSWFTYYGATAGRDYAREVKRGTMTPEAAGAAWQRLADRSHESGEAFLAAYDAAGGPR